MDQKKKGFLPIRTLKESFTEAGFLALTEYKIRTGTVLLTDIDLVAFKNGTLFLGQAKIVIEPDSIYDRWKAEEKMRHAATQLKRCVDHFDDIRSGLVQALGIKEEIRKVVPFIVTNTRQFTERRFLGYPVVDVSYLEFLLHGAAGTFIQPQPGRPRLYSGPSYISGSCPTAEELDHLIHQTIHHVTDRGMLRKHALRRVGDRKVHVPMMRLATPGVPRMIFLEDNGNSGSIGSL